MSTTQPAPEGAAIVLGASGGVGGALVNALSRRGEHERIWALGRARPEALDGVPGAAWLQADFDEEASLEAAAREVAQGPLPRLVIVATGTLTPLGQGPEKSLRGVRQDTLLEAFRINAVGPALAARAFLPLAPRQGRFVFAALSARVGSISDNRLGGWHAYRASKAALNMLIRNAAIELARTRPDAIVAAIHPGTVDTRLSRPFQSGVRPGSLQAPEEAARRILDVLAGLEASQSGGFYAWDGQPIPW